LKCLSTTYSLFVMATKWLNTILLQTNKQRYSYSFKLTHESESSSLIYSKCPSKTIPEVPTTSHISTAPRLHSTWYSNRTCPFATVWSISTSCEWAQTPPIPLHKTEIPFLEKKGSKSTLTMKLMPNSMLLPFAHPVSTHLWIILPLSHLTTLLN
jgi:hypothetical protein